MNASALPPDPRPHRWLARVKPLLPFVSLATGVLSAWWMNRDPDRAPFIVGGAVAAWAVLLLFSGWVSRLTGLARFAVVTATQTLLQQALLFPLPFYLRAASALPFHIVFMATYVTAMACVMWDPLYAWVVHAPSRATALVAFCIFAALAMLLPLLGLDHATGFDVAAIGAALSVAVTLWRQPQRMGRRGIVVAVALATFVAARTLSVAVPPAPLLLTAIAMGTDVADRAVVGSAERFSTPVPQLVCHTAIAAPLGVRDKLVHVWSVDGKPLGETRLKIEGGRGRGFRTWSKRSGPLMPGRYRCEVKTEAGQQLGVHTITIASP